MRVTVLTGLALRELWISYRLLALVAVPLAGGIVIAMRPDAARDPITLAWSVAASGVAVSAIAAASVAHDRREGTMAWLVLRAVPRSSVLVGWLWALAAPVLVGTIAGAALAWLAMSAGSPPIVDASAFTALVTAADMTTLEALALGILVGLVFAPLTSAVLAGVLTAGAAASGLFLRPDPAYLPTGGLGLLAQAGTLERPISTSVQVSGLGLATTGVLLIIAAALLGRSDL